MIFYINIEKKRLCGRNNQTSTVPLVIDYDTQDSLQFQFINSQNQIQHIDGLSGLYLAGNTTTGTPSYDLLFLSKDYTIENDILTFSVETYTVNFLNKIRKKNTYIDIELGQISLNTKTVLLRDNAIANPRVYVAGLSPQEIDSNDYYTKTEVDELINDLDFATEEYVNNGLATKQDVIDADNKLDYAYISNTPAIPTKTSDLDNDSGFITESALSGKQDKITAEAKLAYSLLSGTPTIPTKTSELQNDSGFQTSSDVAAAISGKQNIINADNKLDYAYISNTPTIPTKTSNLQNDSGFITTSALDGYATQQYVDGKVSGKLDASAYVAPYALPYTSAAASWLGQASAAWTDSSIIANDKKVIFVRHTDETFLNFPTITASADEDEVRTVEVWVKVAGDEATGITTIYVPSTYSVIDSDNFPTALKGEAENNEAYTYHIFVVRMIPRATATYCEVNYSHALNTNANY